MNGTRSLLLCLAMPLATQMCVAQDAAGCKDSPLVGRFPGSVIAECRDQADDKFTFTLDKGKTQAVEGEFHQIRYRFPSTASKAQVVRNLNTALRRAGYTMVYDSGDYGDFTGQMGKTWIQIEIGGGGGIQETIVVETQLSQDVVANAAALQSGLAGSGHAVVNGILFDTGKAEVKPESAAALEEVGKLLKQDGALKLYVVGHTDNVGALAANMDLSKRRAPAVVQLLIAQYGAAAARLQSFGPGPYAPLASNDSEDGRAVNRRVELVKQ
ncbi:MAG TPA: OmpA family protein [Bryobacteraceae bacterium]|nr:OmpA family protein [Bryobacteraceae bacterium]